VAPGQGEKPLPDTVLTQNNEGAAGQRAFVLCQDEDGLAGDAVKLTTFEHGFTFIDKRLECFP